MNVQNDLFSEPRKTKRGWIVFLAIALAASVFFNIYQGTAWRTLDNYAAQANANISNQNERISQLEEQASAFHKIKEEAFDDGYTLGLSDGTDSGYQAALKTLSVPMPANGNAQYYINGEPLAPLEVTVPSGKHSFYIVLADAQTNKKAVSLFLTPGKTKEILVPLGTYTFAYACGTQWFGEYHSFGPEGIYYYSDEPCKFYLDKSQNAYMGYLFNLGLVIDGNFDPDETTWESFPK